MLTADLALARRRGNSLELIAVDKKRRATLTEMGLALLEVFRKCEGESRESLERAYRAVDAGPRDVKLRDGLIKLLEDETTFETLVDIDPERVRETVFSASTRAWRDGTFTREAVLAAAAAELGVALAHVEPALFGDLRGAQTIVKAPNLSLETLTTRFIDGQAQAVLLRATQIRVTFDALPAAAVRELYRRLRFLQLLFRVDKLPPSSYEWHIDGPLSMFQAGTRYGTKLAQLLPVLRTLGAFKLDAEVRWGPAREPLRFAIVHDEPPQGAKFVPALGEDAGRLFEQMQTGIVGWKTHPCTRIFHVPGVGLLAPDFECAHESGFTAYVEVLGHWSRDAVWKRVELVEAGLAEPFLFVVGEHLRVSEEVLSDETLSALCAYKRSPSVRQVVNKLNLLLARSRSLLLPE